MSHVVGGEVSQYSACPGVRVLVSADLVPVHPRPQECFLGEIAGDLRVPSQRKPESNELRTHVGEELVVVRRTGPAHGLHTHIHTRTGHRAASRARRLSTNHTGRVADRAPTDLVPSPGAVMGAPRPTRRCSYTAYAALRGGDPRCRPTFTRSCDGREP